VRWAKVWVTNCLLAIRMGRRQSTVRLGWIWARLLIYTALALLTPRVAVAGSSGAEEGKATVNFPREENRQLLVEAYEYWKDWRNREREEAIALFNRYLAAEPDSIWRAEIYTYYGMLYSQKTNRALGEKRDWDKAIEWFEKAAELYGEKYCRYSMLAHYEPAHLSASWTRMREYYEWCRNILEDGTTDNVWPYRRMGSFQWLQKPRLTMEEKVAELKNARENWLPDQTEGAEEVLTRFARNEAEKLAGYPGPAELALLIEAYPGTPLAERARDALEEAAKLESDRVGRVLSLRTLHRLEALPPEDAAAAPGSTGEKDEWRFSEEAVLAAAANAPPDYTSTSQTGPAAANAPPEEDEGARQRDFPSGAVAVGVIIAVAVLVAILYLRRKRESGS